MNAFLPRSGRWAAAMAALVSLLACGGPSAGPRAATRPPNVLVLVADDIGWNDVGYQGSEIHTPVLDRLAFSGVRLGRHYVYPTCSPTRAGLLTGRNASRFGIHGPISDRSADSLPPGTLTLARLLKDRGYATGLSGKWHLGLRPETGPRQYGFDESYGYFHGQIDPLTHRYKNGDRTWHRNDTFIDEAGHATDLIAAEAVRFVQARKEEPFFLYVAFSVPHHPLVEADDWLRPYSDTIKDPSRRLYAASITHMDAAIGSIVEALEKKGCLDETVILFTSDNGGQRDYSSATEYEGRYGPYPTLGDNRPLRGWKGDLYEGGIRIPAFVHWRGHLAPAQVDQPVSCLDWLPTFGALAGSPMPKEARIEGRDVWPLLTNARRPAPPRTLYWNVGNASAVMAGDWKLIVSRSRAPATELYDLAKDPEEKRDLAAQNPAKVEELKGILAEQAKLDP
ncbi:MAG TPA: sulfatase-like hydrolase/transferase [Planctomycetota bacterium]|nr:sulfatase-like hydrolase/transferase [Planctomycetota bacterium]